MIIIQQAILETGLMPNEASSPYSLATRGVGSRGLDPLWGISRGNVPLDPEGNIFSLEFAGALPLGPRLKILKRERERVSLKSFRLLGALPPQTLVNGPAREHAPLTHRSVLFFRGVATSTLVGARIDDDHPANHPRNRLDAQRGIESCSPACGRAWGQGV